MRLVRFTLLLAVAFGGNASAGELRVGEASRTYTAEIPPHAVALPLVLALHGNLQQGADMRNRTAWPEIARREHVAVVFPNGLNRSWADLRADSEREGRKPPAGTDDIRFLVALARHFVDTGVADPKRIYVAGVSNGGAMAMSLACERPDLLAAAAVVIMGMTRGMQPPASPRSRFRCSS